MKNLIDLENHIYPPSLVEYLKTREQYPLWNAENNALHLNEGVVFDSEVVISHLDESLEDRIAMMDAYGIETAVLSVEQGIQSITDQEEAIAQMKAANDYIYEATQKYPGRFLGFAALQIVDIPEAVAELERCVKELGFVGWLTFTNYGRKNLDNEEYWPLLQKAEELGAVVYLHPATLPPAGRVASIGWQLHPLGFGVDCSITVLRLMCQGTLDQYPNLKLLIGHLGETLPFVIEKVDGFMEENDTDIAPARNQQPLKYYFAKNFYITTSGSCSPAVFRCIKDLYGIDHILFSSDYPYDKVETVQQLLEKVGLTEEETAKVLYENANNLLQLTSGKEV